MKRPIIVRGLNADLSIAAAQDARDEAQAAAGQAQTAATSAASSAVVAVQTQLADEVADAQAAAQLARDISDIEVPDDVVKVLINDPESETSAALSATYARAVQVGKPGNVSTTLFRMTPHETDVAPFEIVQREFPSGAGWPDNVLVAYGHNASEYLSDGSGDETKPRMMFNLESGFYNAPDQTYGPEAYVDMGTGGTTPSTSRPFYIRSVLGTGNASNGFLAPANQYSQVFVNIGPGTGGGFAVDAGLGGVNHLLVSKTVAIFNVPQVANITPLVTQRNETGAAVHVIDGDPSANLQFWVNGNNGAAISAPSTNQLVVYDKASAPVTVWNYGATLTASEMDVRASQRVRGTASVKPDSGNALAILDGPGGAQMVFRKGEANAAAFITTDVNQFYIGNKDGTPVTVWNYGANVTASLMDVRASLKVQGNVGFYNTNPVAKPTGVAVTAAGIHAALVTLGLIAA